ncbi:hypothetical protein JTE90_026400 [Oedothorax gibbosus]|uniref:Uncharacterized protein n=1 Tax=Oedothorax gibbosus TaxID=931172 RepID=A0AAV6VFH2_9ARAC|nr:hypothetical protein JTE90_026400 [Oedothorax gibbosus]
MKISALLFVFGLAAALAVPDSESRPRFFSAIELEESSELDEFIRSSESPARNSRGVLGMFGHHVKSGFVKMSENVENFLKKGSQASGSLIEYLKSVGEKSKNKAVQLLYVDSEDESGRRIQDFFISDIFGKIKGYLETSKGFAKVKNVVGKMFEKGDDIARTILNTLKTKGKEFVSNLLDRMPDGLSEDPFERPRTR